MELRLKVGKDAEDEEGRIDREREAMEERGLGVVVNMKDFEVGLAYLGVGVGMLMKGRDTRNRC